MLKTFCKLFNYNLGGVTRGVKYKPEAPLHEAPEISKVLVLSTGHLRRKTRDLLDDAYTADRLLDLHQIAGRRRCIDLPIFYPKGDYGWFVNVPGDCMDEELEVHLRCYVLDLLDCIKYAESLGCDWIMFDRDAGFVADLPDYVW